MLHKYQTRAAAFAVDNHEAALWVDMGLGKTVSTLTALSDLHASVEVDRVLIIAPKRVAEMTWPEEIAKWAHTRNLEYAVIKGTKAQRTKIVRENKAFIHIIGRDNVKWLTQELCGPNVTRLAQWPYDMLVIDESSSFKDPSRSRFKYLRRVRDRINRISRVVELTGTPAPNKLLELWSQMYLLDKGASLGTSYTQYRNRYFIPDYHGYNWTLRPGADKEIYKKLEGCTLVMETEDYLSLPDRIGTTVPVVFSAKLQQGYRELEREFITKVEGETVTADFAAALTNKLQQYANGAVYASEDRSRWVGVHDEKLDALKEIKEAANTPLLVGYKFRSDLDRIKSVFPEAEGLGATDVLARWNAGEVPLLVAHPASAGHGLNLQAGGANIVWFGPPYSLELYQQFNKRLHRQGQTKPVTVHHIVAAGTIDETIMRVLGDKDASQSALLRALKADILAREEQE